MAEDGYIDAPLFKQRVGLIRANLPVDVEGLVVVRGVHSEEFMPEYLTTYSLQVFLTRTELANTIIVVLKDEIYIASGKKKSLSNLVGVPGITMLTCNAKQDVNTEPFKAILAKIGTGKVGVIKDDLKHMKGEHYAEKFLEMMKPIEQVDLKTEMTTMLRVKDNKELAMHKKAGAFCKSLFAKGVVKELQKTFEMEKKITHEKFSNKLADWIDQPSLMKGMDDVEEISAAFAPTIQSGNYTAEFPGTPNTDNLNMTNVTAVAGVRWRQYCAVVGRTFLINPTEEQKAAYDAALAVRSALIKSLKPSVKISDVWKQAAETPPEQLRKHLHIELGFGTGVEWKDTGLTIAKDSPGTIEEGNVVIIRVRLENLPIKDSDSKYVIEILDTIAVMKDGGEDESVLTGGCKVAAESTHLIDDEDDGEEESEPEKKQVIKQRKTTENYELSRGGQWLSKQQEILLANRKATAGLTKEAIKAKKAKDTTAAGKLSRGELTNLVDSRKMKETTDLDIDLSKQVVYFPINGRSVPIHISTIVNTKQETSKGCYVLRLQFKNAQANTNFTPYNLYPKHVFIKELCYKCDITRTAEMEKIRAHIRNIINALKKSDSVKEEVADCSGLIKKPGGGAKLGNVYPKPKVGSGKGMTKPLGDFEAHENGFRFSSKVIPKPIDILYSNVKHVIAAPHTNKHDRYAAVHIRLHKPIELYADSAKTKDFQVYTEVRNEGENISSRNRTSEREDEMDEEAEKRIIDRINKEFVGFAKGLSGKLPEGTVEIPYPDGYFEGAPGGGQGGMGYISTTPSTINSVLDSSIFCLSMDMVEVVVFERVVQGQSSFDAVFVMKDYRIPVQQITNIPVQYLAFLKDALCHKYNTKYYESDKSNFWTNILKEIIKEEQSGNWEAWGSNNGWESMFNLDASSGSGSSDSDSDSDSDEVYSGDSDSDSSSDEWSGDDESSGAASSDDSSDDSSESTKKKRKRDRDDDGKKHKKRRSS